MSTFLVIVLTITLLFSVLYGFSLFHILQGWNLLVTLTDNEISDQPKVSIVVACRNEEKKLPLLLDSLVKQNYPANSLEFIFVDDHSEDSGYNILKKWENEYSNLKIRILQNMTGFGKKRAIQLGVEIAENDLVLCTDADCFMGTDWLQTMVKMIVRGNGKMVLGPVILSNDTTFLSNFQSIEMAGLQSVTAGTVGLGKAVMGNGANILFHKPSYQRIANTVESSRFASGDDVFLVHAFKKEYGGNSILFAKNKSAIVTTFPASTFWEMFWQHLRWSTKSKAYQDKYSVGLSFITAFFNLYIIFLLVYSAIFSPACIVLVFALLIKGILEYQLIRKMNQLSGQSVNTLYYILSTVIYPFFVLIIFLASLRGKYYWKGRFVK